ncbi:MAG TPA: type II toxin-antitoxin system VapC family toxin [Kiritimatiellia bacterium]|nr:type II toxin-antitoxin system VapC family toxin [Kiritimatiellia bacterium]HMP34473.1 type II toxin-antitoxin system VapC family toxin [Kiritimatiellia bacterium]
MMIDTSFCIDVVRERRSGQEGPALRKLGGLGEVRLQMSLFVYCELQHGIHGASVFAAEQRRIEWLTEFVPVILPDRTYAVMYGMLAAALQAKGEGIPQMDLLIGAHAVALGVPLLTRDHGHFRRIEGLVVETYG